MHISIRRTYLTRAPFDLFEELGNDWTHFTHLHRKSHLEFRLLHKHDNREIFLYRTRPSWFIPFTVSYLVLREYLPERHSYHQVYLNLRNGRIQYLRGTNSTTPEGTQSTAEFIFSVSPIWRLFPRLFLWLFDRRVRQVTSEDMECIRERVRLGPFTSPKCAPAIPPVFDLLDDYVRKGLPNPDADFSLQEIDPRQYEKGNP